MKARERNTLVYSGVLYLHTQTSTHVIASRRKRGDNALVDPGVMLKLEPINNCDYFTVLCPGREWRRSFFPLKTKGRCERVFKVFFGQLEMGFSLSLIVSLTVSLSPPPVTQRAVFKESGWPMSGEMAVHPSTARDQA